MEGVFTSFMRDIFAIKYNPEVHDPEGVRIDGDGRCYPNCDSSVWLRSCEKEIIEPIHGETKGNIPNWISGNLIRNGPGSLKVGDMRFEHMFDSSAHLHKFSIKHGIVTYQCRFVQTETFKKNMAAKRIVVPEFGTPTVPDPCQSIFQRVAAVFKPDNNTDNSMISVYPMGDEFYAFGEGPIIHKINPDTLETESRVSITDYVGVMHHSSHPHIMRNGTVYNLGTSATKTGPVYNIICFPHGDSMFEDAHIVATVPCRWKLHPGYMHTFGITQNYFIIVEQPLSISLPEYIKTQFMKQSLAGCLKWFENKLTYIHLIERNTGNLQYTYKAETFFYLHIINQYEDENHVIIDICCYKDPSMLNCMYIESMMNMQYNPNYAQLFKGRPLRFVLPLIKDNNCNHNNIQNLKILRSLSISNITSKLVHQSISSTPTTATTNANGTAIGTATASSTTGIKKSISEYCDITQITCNDKQMKTTQSIELLSTISIHNPGNLIVLDNTKAEAYKLSDGTIFVRPELLCDIGCETPRINYEKYLGRKYRYFYAISSDVDAENPGMLIKIDTVDKTKKIWCEDNVYMSEPIFVPSPGSREEDDGVILSSMVWGRLEENRVGLLILCAKTFEELGRVVFRTPSPVPKCLHGWFLNNNDKNSTFNRNKLKRNRKFKK